MNISIKDMMKRTLSYSYDKELEENKKNQLASKLMINLGIPLTTSPITTNFISIVELYDIFMDKEKLKELIFKLNNKAFL